jgi:hypothetical protein
LWQCGSAVLALQRQDLLGPIRLLHTLALLAHVPGLAARFAPTLLPWRAPAALCARQAVRGRGLGRIGGILLARGQLPFQIGDLLLGVGDLLLSVGDLLLGVGDSLIPFRYLITEFLDLTLLPPDLPLQFFPAWRIRV